MTHPYQPPWWGSVFTEPVTVVVPLRTCAGAILSTVRLVLPLDGLSRQRIIVACENAVREATGHDVRGEVVEQGEGGFRVEVTHGSVIVASGPLEIDPPFNIPS